MKRILTVISALTVSCAAVCTVSASAAEDHAKVYVTIADDHGKLALVREEINVTDTDGDGVLTINDALYTAHEEKFEGGAAKGYSSSKTEFGISMDKLWGAENGGSYGYYLNNAFSNGLDDAVKDGDLISAYVYTDLEAFSDKFCWFDKDTANVNKGDELALVLNYAGYDADWNPVTVPVEGAVITVDGKTTDFITDAEGKVTIRIDGEGEKLISASSDELTLVPPVCIVKAAFNAGAAPDDEPETTTTAKPDSIPKTSDKSTGIFAALGLASMGAVLFRRKK